MQIQISWLLHKPTELDLHSLLRQGMSCSARERLSLDRIKGILAYCVESDQMPQNVASDQGLYCFYISTGISIKHDNNKKLIRRLYIENGFVQRVEVEE